MSDFSHFIVMFNYEYKFSTIIINFKFKLMLRFKILNKINKLANLKI